MRYCTEPGSQNQTTGIDRRIEAVSRLTFHLRPWLHTGALWTNLRPATPFDVLRLDLSPSYAVAITTVSILGAP